MILVRTVLCLNLLVVVATRFIDQGDHKAMPVSNKRFKRASNDHNFGIPWQETDWEDLGRERIKNTLEKAVDTKKAKNVILFIGDGMGLQTVAASRVFKAQKKGLKRQHMYLRWETLPHSSLARTYNVDRITPDSAATGTAYLSGIKANMGTIGVNEKVKKAQCANVKDNHVDSILHKSIEQGKSTGIVTNTRVTHASPAATYSSTPSRDWEAEVPEGMEDCADIASQLVLHRRNQDIRVILGGGSANFLPVNVTADNRGAMGNRKDGKNLIKEWEKRRTEKRETHRVVRSVQELQALPDNVEYVFGLFESSNMNYEVDRQSTNEPSLAQMTAQAIKVLQKNDKGFFLFVEGGRIDHAHHSTLAQKALEETLAFEKAIVKALELVDERETLIVVSADHSHTFSVSGYASFEENILGFADPQESPALDGKPALQLGYINGPGAKFHRFEEVGKNYSEKARLDLSKLGAQIFDKDFEQDAGVWSESEHHGGEDVAVYAGGPWSHLFQATEEQSYVAHVMMYASCVGQYRDEQHCSNTGASLTLPSLTILLFFSRILFNVLL